MSLIFFDAECGLCLTSIRFVARYDAAGVFRFAPLNGETARSAIGSDRVAALGDTVLLVEGGQVFERSTAFVRIVRRLDFPANLLAVVGIVPSAWRDAAYGLVARHRRRIARGAEACPIMPAAWRERFLP